MEISVFGSDAVAGTTGAAEVAGAGVGAAGGVGTAGVAGVGADAVGACVAGAAEARLRSVSLLISSSHFLTASILGNGLRDAICAVSSLRTASILDSKLSISELAGEKFFLWRHGMQNISSLSVTDLGHAYFHGLVSEELLALLLAFELPALPEIMATFDRVESKISALASAQVPSCRRFTHSRLSTPKKLCAAA